MSSELPKGSTYIVGPPNPEELKKPKNPIGFNPLENITRREFLGLPNEPAVEQTPPELPSNPEPAEPTPEPVAEPVPAEASIEAKSVKEILVLQEETLVAYKEMRAVRGNRKIDDLTVEEVTKYKELREIARTKRKVCMEELDKLPEDQQNDLRELTKLQEVRDRLASLTPEQVVTQALEGTIEAYKEELAKLEEEIQEQERLIKYDKDTVRGVTALGNEDDLKALKARRKALITKIASMSTGQTSTTPEPVPPSPEPVVPTTPEPVSPVGPAPEVVPPVPPATAETAPRPILDYERARAEAKARRLELLRESMNAVDRKIIEKIDEHTRTAPWSGVMDRMRINGEIRALRAERTRLDREMNERQGFGAKFKEAASKAYKSVKNRLKFERSKPITLGLIEYPVPSVDNIEQAEIDGIEANLEQGSWGKFIKQRLWGIRPFGYKETGIADDFRLKTKEVGQDVASFTRLIQKERNLSLDDAEDEARKIVAQMKAEGINTVEDRRFLELSTEITEHKVSENDAKIDEIVLTTIDQLEKRLKEYKGDFGQDVLTEENKSKIAIEIRTRLVNLRSGHAEADVKELTSMIRRNLDSKWWRRYVYGYLESILTGVGIGLVGAYMFPAKLSGVALAKGGALAAKESAPMVLEKTLSHLAVVKLHAAGILHPIQAQIQSVTVAMAQENGVKVVTKTGEILWNATSGGILKDIALAKGMLVKMGAAEKAIAVLKAGMIVGG